MVSTVLIAAFSARALAQSARRAGYLPLIVDCFGDEDTRSAAEALTCLPARVQTGFKRKQLLGALQQLVAQAPNKPIGIVLGAGFECSPKLIKAIDKDFNIIGNTPETVEQVKDPDIFFSHLQSRGIAHPKTQGSLPTAPSGWLSKRRGGSGGLHIKRCTTKMLADARRYYQRLHEGVPISVAGVVGAQSTQLAFYKQWLSPTKNRPYRFGGIAGPIDVAPRLAEAMMDTTTTLAKNFNLKGLVSFDFLVSDHETLLLEINPRPTAALDLQDDQSGTIFQAHIATCKGADISKGATTTRQRKTVKALGYLYADQGPLSIPFLEWPLWACDQPQQGTSISTGQPIASALVHAETPEEAISLCHNHLGRLENLLYGRPQ